MENSWFHLSSYIVIYIKWSYAFLEMMPNVFISVFLYFDMISIEVFVFLFLSFVSCDEFKIFLCMHLVNYQFSDYVGQDIVMYVNSPGGSVTAGNSFLVKTILLCFFYYYIIFIYMGWKYIVSQILKCFLCYSFPLRNGNIWYNEAYPTWCVYCLCWISG